MCNAVLAIATFATALSQDPAALQRRLDRLAVLRREAGTVLTHADSANRERLDTIRAGALVIAVQPQDAAMVRRGAELAWPQLDSLYGDGAAVLSTRPMIFWFMREHAPIMLQFDKLEPVVGDPTFTREDVARQLMSGAAKLLREGTDTALSNWLGSLLVPETQRTVESGRIYVELVTAPGAAVRRCYSGDAGSCRASLGLLDGGDAVALWFDAAERRAMVAKTTAMERRSVQSAADACLVEHSDKNCMEVLRAVRYIEPPLSSQARHSFARFALVTGGRTAYGILQGSAGRPLSERFAIAAGLPADSLTLRWRATIVAARPGTVIMAAASGWAALGWAVLFTLLALRSTRWR